MNHRMRRIVETLACERRYGIADAKGAEYSGKGSTYKETGADTLANFKNVAERIGGTSEQVLMTYLLKHIDSINTAVREAAQHNPAYVVFNRDPKTVYAGGEGIVSRLDDARNYLDLLECLLIDRGLIEPVRDTEGEKYAEIGAGAAEAEERLAAKLGGPFTPKGPVTKEDWEMRFPPELTPQQDALLNGDLERAGLVQGLDGVWRGATKIDESVKNPGEIQTPIYARPAVFDPPRPTDVELTAMEDKAYGETGELT